jgi:hypothetical protein
MQQSFLLGWRRKWSFWLPLLHRMMFQFSPSGQLEHIKVLFQYLCGDNVLREKRKCHNNKTRKFRSVLVAHIIARHRGLFVKHCRFVFVRLPTRICDGKRLTPWNKSPSCDSNKLRNVPHFMDPEGSLPYSQLANCPIPESRLSPFH